MQPPGGLETVWKPFTEDIQCPRDALHHAEGLSCLNWKGVIWLRQVTQGDCNKDKDLFRPLAYQTRHLRDAG